MSNFWKQLPKPFTVLAPMEQVTDMAFREMVVQNLSKPDVIFTEFVSADGLVYNQAQLVKEKLEYSQEQRPIVAQVWGTDPKNLEVAAKVIQDLGFDGIDINMGCPDKHVVKMGGGAGQIRKPELVSQVIDAVKNGASKIPLSIKTRIGFDRTITEEWISVLLREKPQAITIHARTYKQLSKGKADWNEIKKVVELKNRLSPETLIIGNGDINSYENVLKAHETYGVDGVMIGRGIFKDPFVFGKVPHRLTKEEKISLVEKHIDLIQKHGGLINKFLRVYLSGFRGAKELRIRYLNQNIV